MRKLMAMVVAVLSAAVGLSDVVRLDISGDPACKRAIGVAWNRLFDKLWSPKTGLLYEHLPDETPGSIERLLPTPAEIAKNEPIATGWNTGMEDGVLT